MASRSPRVAWRSWAAALLAAVPAAANAAPPPTWRAPISVFTSVGAAQRSIAVGDRGQAIMVTRHHR